MADMSVTEIAQIADRRMYEEKSCYYEKCGVDAHCNMDIYKSLDIFFDKIIKINLDNDTYKIIKDGSEEHSRYGSMSQWIKTVIKGNPICGNGIELKAKEAKAEMASGSINDQNIQIYAKHFNANKPKGLLAVDTNYEVWVKDVNTGEDIGLVNNIDKDFIKSLKKERGIKIIPIREIQ